MSFLKKILYFSIFSLPFSINFILWENLAYFSGHFSNFSSILIYISDIGFLITLFYALFLHIKGKDIFEKKNKKIIGSFLGLFLTSLILIFFTENFLLHIFIFFKFFIILFLFLFLNENVLKRNNLEKILFLSFFFQGIISLLQIYLQKSIGLNFLGEVLLSQETLGVAKINLESFGQIIRAYGTTNHPNILGTCSALAFFLIKQKDLKVLKYFLIFPIFLSFSKLAIFIFIISLYFEIENIKSKKLFYLPKNIFLGLSFFGILGLGFWKKDFLFEILKSRIFDFQSFYERFEQLKVSIKIFLENPFGIGFGNFTNKIQEFSTNILEPWDFQIIHNSFLLILNELGIFGIIFFLSLIFFIFSKGEKNYLLLFFLFLIGTFEHFLISSTIGISFLAILLRFL